MMSAAVPFVNYLTFISYIAKTGIGRLFFSFVDILLIIALSHHLPPHLLSLFMDDIVL